VDLAHPDFRIAIEYDSDRWHSGRRRREADAERRNRITAAGWHVVHVTAAELAAGAPTAIPPLQGLIQAG
jgi:very-short-patch-repair endonuclease